MGKPQLVVQRNSLPVNEMGIFPYYYSVLDLKDESLFNNAKIKEEAVEVRTQFLGSKWQPFRKITVPKSINH